jgi:hypothetical protein
MPEMQLQKAYPVIPNSRADDYCHRHYSWGNRKSVWKQSNSWQKGTDVFGDFVVERQKLKTAPDTQPNHHITSDDISAVLLRNIADGMINVLSGCSYIPGTQDPYHHEINVYRDFQGCMASSKYL